MKIINYKVVQFKTTDANKIFKQDTIDKLIIHFILQDFS